MATDQAFSAATGEATQMLQEFWPTVIQQIRSLTNVSDHTTKQKKVLPKGSLEYFLWE